MGMLVKAVDRGARVVIGFYGAKRIRSNEEFVISNIKEFSDKWMIKLGDTDQEPEVLHDEKEQKKADKKHADAQDASNSKRKGNKPIG